jgi:hypothetical protein
MNPRGILVARSTLRGIEWQAEETANAAIAAKASAEAAQHTVEMMRLDQRAWVGATKVRITDFHPGEVAKVMICMRNIGKTAAFNVTADRHIDQWGKLRATAFAPRPV